MLDLRCDLQLEVAEYCLASLPALLQVCAPLRSSLRSALAQQRRLSVCDVQAPWALAELLAQCLPSLESVELEGQLFPLEHLRSQKCLCLRLSLLQAAILGPLLRSSSVLESVVVTPSAGRWGIRQSGPLDVRRLRSFPPGMQLRWRGLHLHQGDGGSLAAPRTWVGDMPACDAECIFIAGLMQAERVAAEREPGPPRCLSCGRRRRRSSSSGGGASEPGGELALDGRLLGDAARRSLGFASRRCGIDMKALSGLPRPQKAERPCWSTACCWVLLGLGMLILRALEDSYARSTGHGGALFPTHPLKAMSFAGRLQHSGLMESPTLDAALLGL